MKDNQVLALSYNGAPPKLDHCDDVGCEIVEGHCIRATHAEVNAIAGCARVGVPTLGTELWVTQTPCHACAKALLRAGVKRVFYLDYYGSWDGVDTLAKGGVEVCHIRSGMIF